MFLRSGHSSQASTDSPPSLRLRLGDGSAKICDERTSPGREYTISGEYLDLILLCDRIQVRSALEQKLGERYLPSRVTQAINDLLEHGVLIQERKKILSLAVADRPRSTKHLESKAIGSKTDSVIKKLIVPVQGKKNGFVVQIT